jgi:hypothetical protein
VTTVPGTSDQIQLVNVSGTPTYIAQSSGVNNGTEGFAVTAVSALTPGEPVTMASQSEALTGLTASTFTQGARLQLRRRLRCP